MNRILVTGANGFLGYHIIKQFNQKGIRPYALVPDLDAPSSQPLKQLDVELIKGSVTDPSSLPAAFKGMDTIIHMEFKVELSDDQQAVRRMQEINLEGSRALLKAAKTAGATKVVVNSSVLAIGINHIAEPLDQSVDWTKYRFDLPYALSRRQVENEALALATPGFSVMIINPSFTLGPEDFITVPAVKVLQLVSAGKVPVSVPIGLGVLDVRDFADGVVRVAEQGRSGQRYILSGENVMFKEFLTLASEVAGVKPPRWTLPAWLVKIAICIIRGFYRLRNKPVPVAAAITKLLGAYAWYNADLARNELGWTSRPLRESIEDTLRWTREQGEQSK